MEFIDNLKLFGKGCSWVDLRALLFARFTKASQEELDFLGTDRGLTTVLYCGLEGEENLLEDLETALKKL